MIYDYITDNYSYGDPILISELPCNSKGYLRQQLKQLTDDGMLNRAEPGVYYLPYKTILGTQGKINIDTLISKKYLSSENDSIGYLTGLSLANAEGFTSQNPSVLEIRTNNVTTVQRKVKILNTNIILYKPFTEVNNENVHALMFLDLMLDIDKYSELEGIDIMNQFQRFQKKYRLNFDAVVKCIKYYPDRVYKNIYEKGFMNELV